MAAQGPATPPVASIHEVAHVMGRRVLATIVDGLDFGLFFIVMVMLFGTITREGFPLLERHAARSSNRGIWRGHRPLLHPPGRLSGPDRGQDATRHKGHS